MKPSSLLMLFGLSILASCKEEASKESHFIYFSPTEPYTRIGGVGCSIDNLTGEITNTEKLPAGTDITAMKVWFVTNYDNEGVFVNGKKQQSGVTVNDFTSPVEYEVRTKDETRKYTVSFTLSETCDSQAGIKLEAYTAFVESIDSDKSWWLSPAVRVSEVNFTSVPGRKLKLCLFEVDLTDPSILVRPVLPNDGDEWGMQNMVDQAKAVENSGNHVLGAINGDYFDWDGGAGTGEPDGIVCRDGEYLKDTFDDPGTGGFFGIRKDGRAAIGDYNEFLQIKDKLYSGIGGQQKIVISNGAVATLSGDSSLANRTAIGMNSADLKTLYMVVVEGLDAGDPKGIKLLELADCMVKLGVGHAVNLDGGGSSTFVVRENDDFKAFNRPAGPLRKVGDGLVIISK